MGLHSESEDEDVGGIWHSDSDDQDVDFGGHCEGLWAGDGDF